MPHVLIIHEVEAYPAWKVIFDQAADVRRRAGEIRYQLLRHDHDANTIVHFSEWSSLENARRFFESPELVEIRRQAGVKAPDFLYLQEIERGVLYPHDRTGRRREVLELRPTCEQCNRPLPPDSTDARICSYECTFCAACVESIRHNVCPNCGGRFYPDPSGHRRGRAITVSPMIQPAPPSHRPVDPRASRPLRRPPKAIPPEKR
ncbi:MAG: DUF1272 domain-containing protein [Nitrospiraceae bacterium]